MNFVNKVVLITGGAGGIGEALGRLLLEKGSKVCLCDINVTHGHKVTKDLQKEFGEKNIIFLKCDVTKEEDIEAAYNGCEKELGTIDILCNNAATASKNYQTSVDINLGGVVKGTELGIKKMSRQHGGKGGFIINTGSILGLRNSPIAPMYSATKAAVIHYTRDTGHEFHFNYNGVYISCICPGLVDTPLVSRENLIEGAYDSNTLKLLPEFQTSPRLRPRDVAEGFIQLIKDRKPGSVLVVEPEREAYYVPSSIQEP